MVLKSSYLFYKKKCIGKIKYNKYKGEGTMKKRALAIIMAGLMAASMSSVCAYAEALVCQMVTGEIPGVHRW